MDFTIKTYRKLIKSFVDNGYQCITYEEYIADKDIYDVDNQKFVILRHDVDEYATNALNMAKAEFVLGVKATYYFRIVKQSDKPKIIKEIAEMGHEIGYHYEDLALSEGNLEKAKESFEENLNYFRTYYPVKTVCMHGSSTSKYDNRIFWENFQLVDFQLVGEPYLTTNFEKINYLTDTGYAWDGGKYAVRDIVKNNFGVTFHSSQEIVKSVEQGKFPNKNLILAHTLWSDNLRQWLWLHTREFLRNNLKYMAQHNKFIKRIYGAMVRLYWRK